jgi:hypothetical protein
MLVEPFNIPYHQIYEALWNIATAMHNDIAFYLSAKVVGV